MTEEKLRPFLPEDSVGHVIHWISKYKVILTITEKRNSLLGDYHPPHQLRGHRISVNGDLNRYAFLITFVHEMAHLTTFEKYRHTVSSHGNEWKHEFKILMDEFRGKKLFPRDVTLAMKKYLANPSSTHCDDPELMRVLNKYNQQPVLHLDELREGELFTWEGKRIFRKGEKLRKRYKCYEVKTNRIYLFNPVAEVKRV